MTFVGLKLLAKLKLQLLSKTPFKIPDIGHKGLDILKAICIFIVETFQSNPNKMSLFIECCFRQAIKMMSNITSFICILRHTHTQYLAMCIRFAQYTYTNF